MRQIFIISLILISWDSFSSEKLFIKADSLFLKADSLYYHDNFKESISCYEKIIQSGLESPELYLNMGICYFTLKEYKKSKIFFSKSLLLNPKLLIAQQNIQLCNNKISSNKNPTLFYKDWWNNLLDLFKLSHWIFSSFILIIILSILTIIKLYLNKRIPIVILILTIIINIMLYSIITSKQKKTNKIFEKDNVSLTENKS